jgi:hypothetical protein
MARRTRRDRLNRTPRDAAEAVAIAALSYLAGEPEKLGRFLAATGIGPERIREAARDPGFLAGVLDHFSGDEPLLIAFAREHDLDPVAIERARAALAGITERDLP